MTQHAPHPSPASRTQTATNNFTYVLRELAAATPHPLPLPSPTPQTVINKFTDVFPNSASGSIFQADGTPAPRWITKAWEPRL